MKKIFISILAVAALAACSKSEVQYEPAGEIGFAPVASNVTKSVAGYNGETFDGVFPTDVDLYVFANAVEGETGVGDAYFKNAKFEHSNKGTEDTQENISTAGAYAGTPTRYWPNVKKLIFAGYSDACNSTSTNATMTFGQSTTDGTTTPTTSLVLTGYTQDNSKTAEGVNDLMWFAWDGKYYGKSEGEVPAKMQHACSWITIKVAGDATTGAENTTWKLNSLKVKNLYHTGTATCTSNKATWSTLSVQNDEYYYKNDAGAALTTSSTNYETVGEGTSVSNNFIVIPQTPTELEVTYTYTSDAANNITLTETKSVPLKYTAADGENSAWLSGVHYTYTITITATEILIDPYVTEWTETTVTPETTI